MKIKEIIIRILGPFMDKVFRLVSIYKTLSINDMLGKGERTIAFPYTIRGIENIIAESPINIGPNSTIYTTGAKLIIKKHFISGPNLTIITGDHHYMIGKFVDEISEKDKLPENDKDVIIEEDVWCGANVIILKGVTIGRGSIVAAGSVVTRSCPPYSIIGGVPAKVIRMKFTEEQIKQHEQNLYDLK